MTIVELCHCCVRWVMCSLSAHYLLTYLLTYLLHAAESFLRR